MQNIFESSLHFQTNSGLSKRNCYNLGNCTKHFVDPNTQGCYRKFSYTPKIYFIL